MGAGEEGVGGSSMKAAPEHLNAKEREIWGLLMRELGPSELEVCFHSSIPPLSFCYKDARSRICGLVVKLLKAKLMLG
jgi:hypothetical protein